MAVGQRLSRGAQLGAGHLFCAGGQTLIPKPVSLCSWKFWLIGVIKLSTSSLRPPGIRAVVESGFSVVVLAKGHL